MRNFTAVAWWGCCVVAMMLSGCSEPRVDAYGRHRIANARHRAAEKLIESHRGSVLQEDAGSNVIVDLRGLETKQARATLAAVNDLFQVHTLTLLGPLPEDVSLGELRALPAMQVLILENVRLSEADWQAIARQPALESLTLTDTGTGDAQLNALLQLNNLRRLTLVNQPLTEAGVARLAQLGTLRRVRLVNSGGTVALARQLVDANPYLIVDVEGERIRGIEATE